MFGYLLNYLLRVSDKMKKAPPNFYKKAPVRQGPLLASEKSTLSVRLDSRERAREEPLLLPELRPSDGELSFFHSSFPF